MDDNYILNDNERKIKIFISCAREDEKSAIRLYNDLKNSGFLIQPWIDKEDLLPGQDFNREMNFYLH